MSLRSVRGTPVQGPELAWLELGTGDDLIIDTEVEHEQDGVVPATATRGSQLTATSD